MALIPLIEFVDESGDAIVYRVPEDGTGEFKTGAQLVVQESQTAVFFRDGQALDSFTAGRHTLSTENLPFLKKLLGAAFGGKSPFRAYVYFVSGKTFTGLGWGTGTPVLFRDSDLKMVSLRAYGSFAIRITKVRTFLNTIVGTRGIQWTHNLEEYLRSIIVSRFTAVVGRRLKSILDLPMEYTNIGYEVKQETAEDFSQYGIELVDMLVEAITVPPDVQEMINKATGINAQDAGKYRIIAEADALRDAVKNPGGIGEMMGTGLGLGLGMKMANQFSGGQGGGAPAPIEPEKLTMQQIKDKLAQLKQLKEEDLISDSDYDDQKKKLLDRLQ